MEFKFTPENSYRKLDLLLYKEWNWKMGCFYAAARRE